MIEPRTFNFDDGRVGTFNKSDRVYKVVDEIENEIDENGNLVYDNDGNIKTKTVTKTLYYPIKQIDTGSIYGEAIDIVHHNYVEVTEEEAKEYYGDK